MITEKQLKAAWEIANKRTDSQAYQAAGVSERTLYKWKQKPEFISLVKLLSEQRESQIADKAEELVSLASSRNDEEKALSYQRLMVAELGQLSIDLIKQMRADGVEELGPRYLGPIVKSFADSVAMLQSTNDRLVGLESLILDVQQIEEALQLKAEPESAGRNAEGSSGGIAAYAEPVSD
ncbi:MAG: phBC6A51 family helix-turn-helix protein [Phormidesmis sp.]